jgi:hypothetical protein
MSCGGGGSDGSNAFNTAGAAQVPSHDIMRAGRHACQHPRSNPPDAPVVHRASTLARGAVRGNCCRAVVAAAAATTAQDKTVVSSTRLTHTPVFGGIKRLQWQDPELPGPLNAPHTHLTQVGDLRKPCRSCAPAWGRQAPLNPVPCAHQHLGCAVHTAHTPHARAHQHCPDRAAQCAHRSQSHRGAIQCRSAAGSTRTRHLGPSAAHHKRLQHLAAAGSGRSLAAAAGVCCWRHPARWAARTARSTPTSAGC